MMFRQMAKKILECVVDKISLIRKGKRPAVAHAENKFTIMKMRHGSGEENEPKTKLNKEQKEKLEKISEKYNRHGKK